MILAPLILAAAGATCADRAACPTRAEVERALAEQHRDHVSRLNDDANPPGSDTIVERVRLVRRHRRWEWEHGEGIQPH